MTNKKSVVTQIILFFLLSYSTICCATNDNNNNFINNGGNDHMKKIVQTAGRDNLGIFAPEFAHFNDDILFGENWNNTDITLKTRSLITIISLMSQGITDSSLKYHLQNA